MTLYKQIISLITVCLLFISAVILFSVLKYNKNLLEEQLSSNAKNTAVFLGLYLSKNVDIDDKATMDGMVSSLLDNGFYQAIKIQNVDGKEIFKAISSEENKEEVPSLFKKIFKIKEMQSSANIMNGWTQLGSVEVQVHQGFANEQMWKTFKTVSQIFLVFIIALLGIFYLFIDRLLKPLKKLNNQAKAIDNNEFIIEEELPNTVEFKNVALSMNKTISKMETIFNKSVSILNNYNDLFYKDPDTKLGNRNYLELKLDSYLKNSSGILFFIEIEDRVEFKKSIGYKDYMKFKMDTIEKINELFSSNKDRVLSILRDGTLTVVIPHVLYEDIDCSINSLYSFMQEYIKTNGFDKKFDISYAIASAGYTKNMSIKQLLTKADISLNEAFEKVNKKINFIPSDRESSKDKWIEIIKDSLENDKITYVKQNILDVKTNNYLMSEYYARIKKDDNSSYSFADFSAVVLSLNLMVDIEKKLILKVLEEKEGLNSSVINLSESFISDKNNIDWLISILSSSKTSKTFFFEAVNSEVLRNIESCKYLSLKLKEIGHNFAIESFSLDSESLDYLKELKPEYLKISKLFFVGNDNKVIDNVLSNIVSTLGIYLIVKHVETNEEFELLKKDGMRYLQGNYIDIRDDK